MITHSLAHPMPYPKLGLLKFPRINLRIVWFFGFLLLISLMIFYIFQSNSFIKQGYLIQNYQQRVEELREENKALEVNFVQTNSLATIEQRIQELNFVEIEKINYIQLLSSQIATK